MSPKPSVEVEAGALDIEAAEITTAAAEHKDVAAVAEVGAADDGGETALVRATQPHIRHGGGGSCHHHHRHGGGYRKNQLDACQVDYLLLLGTLMSGMT